MAERGGNWWDSWYKAAKNKSVEVLEFVKRDLDEFSTAVKSEASNVVSSTTTVLKDKLKFGRCYCRYSCSRLFCFCQSKERRIAACNWSVYPILDSDNKIYMLDEPESTANTMKRSVSSFLGQMSSALNPSPQDDDEEAIVIYDSQPVPLTKFQVHRSKISFVCPRKHSLHVRKKLHAITIDPNTFLTEPSDANKPQYKAWLEIVEDQLTPERLTKLMTASPELHCQYTKLVPEEVSHQLFWQRYLFHKALLEDEEARLEALERRAERERQAAESFCWEKEQDFASNIELSEEEQIRLLQEYEKECEDKKLQSSVDREDSLLVENLKDNYYSVSSAGLPMSQSDTKLYEAKQCENLQKEVESSDVDAEKDDIDILRTKEKKDLVIVSSDGISCHTSSCSGDKESNDEDWEREFDLDESESDITEPQIAASAKA